MENPIEQGARIRDLRNELRKLEAQSERTMSAMQPITIEQEHAMVNTQSRLDRAYQEAGRRAPPPDAHERPDAYHRRLLSGLAHYSDDWRGKSLSGVTDPNALAAIETHLAESARRNGPAFGLKENEIKPIDRSSGMHRVTEWVGGKNAHFTQTLNRPAPRVQLKSREEYNQISQSNMLSKIASVVPGWARNMVRSGRPSF
jgi:hypothetical protein